VARSATASCQPSDSESAQNTAAFLTHSLSWARRDGGGEACRCRGGAEAGDANAASAEGRCARRVLDDGLRRALPEPRREDAAVAVLRLRGEDFNPGADPRLC
jgi:hypothetical protein